VKLSGAIAGRGSLRRSRAFLEWTTVNFMASVYEAKNKMQAWRHRKQAANGFTTPIP
jgi:hypothetical protein